MKRLLSLLAAVGFLATSGCLARVYGPGEQGGRGEMRGHDQGRGEDRGREHGRGHDDDRRDRD
jgi:Ni/Co efflux regulator RcnB